MAAPVFGALVVFCVLFPPAGRSEEGWGLAILAHFLGLALSVVGLLAAVIGFARCEKPWVFSALGAIVNAAILSYVIYRFAR